MLHGISHHSGFGSAQLYGRNSVASRCIIGGESERHAPNWVSECVPNSETIEWKSMKRVALCYALF